MGAFGVKVAVTERSRVICTTQDDPSVESQPDQLALAVCSAAAVKLTLVPLVNDAEHVEPQLMPWPVTLPLAVPALSTESVYELGAKLAVTVRFALICTMHEAPELESQPLQLEKTEPAVGVAVRVTLVPFENEAEQVPPQLMPLPLTVPAPFPAFWTVSVGFVGAPANAAETVRLAFIATVQLVPVAESQPIQPAKVEPASGEAVRMTDVPAEIEAEQVAPQLMPLPLTVPAPVPVFWTVSVAFVGSPALNAAETVRLAFIATLQLVPVAESQPVQPAKVERASGEAVRMTVGAASLECEEIHWRSGDEL